jgi:hypothetical protein
MRPWLSSRVASVVHMSDRPRHPQLPQGNVKQRDTVEAIVGAVRRHPLRLVRRRTDLTPDNVETLPAG